MMFERALRLGCLVVSFATAEAFAGIQSGLGSCPCSGVGSSGVLWSGASPLGLTEIADIAAPVLWFSRDEPLLRRGEVIPSAHPCDLPSATPIVYYQVIQIAHRGEAEVGRPEENDPEFFRKVDRMILKFLFYYSEDIGVGAHPHDLEAVELELELSSENGCYQLSLENATGLSHGSRWYSNILEIDAAPDTKYPLTLFVEEGKHSVAIDRNADGYFTRGYDVNRTVNDAWGVRDVMGSGVLLSSGYNPEMTKPRRFQERVLPPEVDLRCVAPGNSSLQLDEGYLSRYELRPGNRVPSCEVPRGEYLKRFTEYHKFGEDELPAQFSAGSIENAFRGLAHPDRFLSFSLRAEGGLGLGMVFRGLDLRQGWIVPKVNVNGYSASAGLMYTPSASRFFDWYLAGGVRRQFASRTETVKIDSEAGSRDIQVVRPPSWDLYTETGIKIRARVSPKVRPFALGYEFAGLRLGVQALGTGRLSDIRLIFEMGAGAW